MKSSNMSDRDFEEKLTRTFDCITEDIKASDKMFDNIKSELKGGNTMKFKLKKSYVIAAAVVLSLTAATGIVASTTDVSIWFGSSSNLTAKTEFPDKETIETEFAYNFKYVKEFTNGFKFDNYNYSDEKGMDSNGNIVIESKEAHFNYVKDSGSDTEQTVYFHADKRPEYMFSDKYYDKAVNYKDVEIHYSDYIYKCFPPDFEEKEVNAEDREKAEKLMAEVRKTNPDADDLTKVYPYLSEEEIEAYKQNKLMLAYGSQEIESFTNQSVIWYDNGIVYNLMSMHNEWIEPDEFIDMAKQVIDSGDIADVVSDAEKEDDDNVKIAAAGN